MASEPRENLSSINRQNYEMTKLMLECLVKLSQHRNVCIGFYKEENKKKEKTLYI